jgi:hypothetical protein
MRSARGSSPKRRVRHYNLRRKYAAATPSTPRRTFLVAVVFGATHVYTQDAPAFELLHVQGNVSMLAGAGANMAVQVGKDGILLVDYGAAAMTPRIVDLLWTLSKGQVTYTAQHKLTW